MEPVVKSYSVHPQPKCLSVGSLLRTSRSTRRLSSGACGPTSVVRVPGCRPWARLAMETAKIMGGLAFPRQLISFPVMFSRSLSGDQVTAATGKCTHPC